MKVNLGPVALTQLFPLLYLTCLLLLLWQRRLAATAQAARCGWLVLLLSMWRVGLS